MQIENERLRKKLERFLEPGSPVSVKPYSLCHHGKEDSYSIGVLVGHGNESNKYSIHFSITEDRDNIIIKDSLPGNPEHYDGVFSNLVESKAIEKAEETSQMLEEMGFKPYIKDFFTVVKK